LNNSTITIHWN